MNGKHFDVKDMKREFKRGAKQELNFLLYTIEADVKDNKVWKEGNQYFEVIIDLIEKRLSELK